MTTEIRIGMGPDGKPFIWDDFGEVKCPKCGAVKCRTLKSQPNPLSSAQPSWARHCKTCGYSENWDDLASSLDY
jgi:hypothetical protein